MTIFVLIIVRTALGYIGQAMAENRHRNPTIGFLSGFFLGLTALFIYWLLGSSK